MGLPRENLRKEKKIYFCHNGRISKFPGKIRFKLSRRNLRKKTKIPISRAQDLWLPRENLRKENKIYFCHNGIISKFPGNLKI